MEAPANDPYFNREEVFDAAEPTSEPHSGVKQNLGNRAIVYPSGMNPQEEVHYPDYGWSLQGFHE